MLKVLGRIVGAFLALCVLYGAAALLLGAIPSNRDFVVTPGGIPIAVCSNGVHTDFVLPVKTETVDWAARFPPAHYPVDVTRFDHIGIGWGDLDFYRTTPRWADFDLGVALRALAGFGPAALHVQYRPGPGLAERCAALTVGAAEYRRLVDYIDATRIAGTPVAAGYGASDAFFPARGRFGLFKSCNVWVGEGLKAAGLPTALWTPLAFQVMARLEPAARSGH